MRVFVCCSIFLLFFAACKQDQKTKGPETGLTSDPPKAEVRFRCESSGEDENGNPQTQVFLVVNDQSIKVADVSSCEEILKEDYPKYQIPANALGACGGWWAGAGDYFYAVEIKDLIVVMQGWQDESQEDEGFHYQQISTVPIQ
ncbi:hypothetical protein Halhy_3663 [Haliscomenobacter hydrossis DSM 1100]|uniref:Lipoprotein n=2 Tax=Haliscomenobacter TaxID=2349 RepID=F4KZU5_HALH1|nr:hypothetical protein Halhy_3663 [Haliscomenobacter hydrossis DSM 1100]